MRTSLAKAENIKQDNSSQIAWMRIKSSPGLCPKNMAGTRISILSIMRQCPKQNQSQVHAHSAKKPDPPASKQEVHILAFRVLKRFLIPLSSTVRLDWCLTFVSEVKDDTIKSAGSKQAKRKCRGCSRVCRFTCKQMRAQSSLTFLFSFLQTNVSPFQSSRKN